MEQFVEWEDSRVKLSARRNPETVPQDPPHIPYELTWDLTGQW
jgi:hypothetical protein